MRFASSAVVAICVAVAVLALVLPNAAAKEPREWRIEFLDTGETVLIRNPDRAIEFFNEVHYSVTGGTPVEPDPNRPVTALVYGNPCNPPYSCESLWYRYSGPVGAEPAFMSYYLSDGTLYETWTAPNLQATMDSYRTAAPSDSPSRPWASAVPLVAVAVVVVGGAAVALALRSRRTEKGKPA